MKLELKKILKKENKKKAPITMFENAKGFERLRCFIPNVKGFLYNTKQTFGGIKADGGLWAALLFALSLNLILIILSHIFSTYIFKDSVFFLGEINTTLGKAAPVFPLYKGLFIIAAPFIAAFLFFFNVLLYHLAVLPQKPKKGFKATLKIAAYAESSKIYLIFLYIFLIIARIPTAADDYFKGLATWCFIILWLLSIIGSIKIVIQGCMKFHKLTESESIFVAFFPVIIIYIVPLIISGIL